MIGIGNGIIIGLMAGKTIRRGAGIDFVNMTEIAGHRDMRAGQRKFRRVMVECGRRPHLRSMAVKTILTELPADMVGTFHRSKIFLMTGIAIGGRSRVNSGGMTQIAGSGGVRAGQGKSRLIMIKGGRRPGHRGMTHIAVGGEDIGSVVGIGNGIIIGLVAGKTHGRNGLNGGGVTIAAIGNIMPAGQRESRGMSETYPLPLEFQLGMTGFAVGIKTDIDMRRILRRRVHIQMTAFAIQR